MYRALCKVDRQIVSAYAVSLADRPPYVHSEGAQGLACKTPIKI